jgi:spermidine/putrescine transport system permease protein
MESWRNSRLVFLLIGLPPTFWLVFFFLAPLAIIAAFSFGEKVGVIDIEVTGTLDSYWRIFECVPVPGSEGCTRVYLTIFWKSLWEAGLTTLICILIGFPLALMISFASPKWKPWLLLLIVLPFWTNLLIRTYALIVMLRGNGFINKGLEAAWNGADWVTFGALGNFTPLEMMNTDFAVVFGMVYVFLPFTVLPLYAALERLDHSFIEASLDLGAGHLRAFWTVIVPLAMPGIASALIITFIPALGTFLQPDLLGGTDSSLIANIIERQFRSANDWPFGAALSLMLLYITFIAIALQAFFSRRRQQRGREI